MEVLNYLSGYILFIIYILLKINRVVQKLFSNFKIVKIYPN